MTSNSAKSPVLLIDDEAEIRRAWEETLHLRDFTPQSFEDAERAVATLQADWSGVVLTDLRMPGMDGFGVLEAVKRIDPKIPVIIVTGHGDIPMATKAVRLGAYDFIEKPADPEMLLAVVGRACELRRLILENRCLTNRSEDGYRIENHIIGNHPKIERLRQQTSVVAGSDVNTIIYGETGTGKELVARALHELGPRKKGPFVAINCGALQETLIASELFGHESGAFTGADRRHIGKLEQASGGTLFLDEIESMPLNQQTQLLRALQGQTIERLGGKSPISIDVRVVAAAKDDLEQASEENRFRADLYYRLAVASLTIPPLRERGDDIALLFVHYVSSACSKRGLKIPEISEISLDELRGKSWPGNVRELVNAAERYALQLENASTRLGTFENPVSLPDQIDAFEKKVISSALRRCAGKVQETADYLDIPRKKLYLRMQYHNIDKRDFMDTE